MGFNCGIVGLPNVGKSTIFNALTKAKIQAENYPFCTIDPNVGIVSVPDPRLSNIANIVTPKKIVPTFMEFVDIAGLVKGASKGEGLGNKFLANIRETDAIAHVVRCFADSQVTHVHNQVNPTYDIDIINTELTIADLELGERALTRYHKLIKAHDKEAGKIAEFLRHLLEGLDQNIPIRAIQHPDKDELIKHFHFLTSKPILYIANVDEHLTISKEWLNYLNNIVKKEHGELILMSAKIESEIAELNQEEQKEFLQDLGQKESGLNQLINAGYSMLGLETFFTAGPKEVHAWTYEKGSLAPQAAGKIHTDFEKGFIRAEVISYDDYIQFKGELGAKGSGKMRSEGKDYIMKDGDIVLFRFNV